MASTYQYLQNKHKPEDFQEESPKCDWGIYCILEKPSKKNQQVHKIYLKFILNEKICICRCAHTNKNGLQTSLSGHC